MIFSKTAISTHLVTTAIPASSAHIIEVDHSLMRTRPTVSQCSSSQMIPEFTAGRGPIVYGSAPLAPFSFGDKYSNIGWRKSERHTNGWQPQGCTFAGAHPAPFEGTGGMAHTCAACGVAIAPGEKERGQTHVRRWIRAALTARLHFYWLQRKEAVTHATVFSDLICWWGVSPYFL